jgi:hypothetical protein
MVGIDHRGPIRPLASVLRRISPGTLRLDGEWQWRAGHSSLTGLLGELAGREAYSSQRTAKALLVSAIEIKADLERQPAYQGANGRSPDPQRSGRERRVMWRGLLPPKRTTPPTEPSAWTRPSPDVPSKHVNENSLSATNWRASSAPMFPATPGTDAKRPAIASSVDTFFAMVSHWHSAGRVGLAEITPMSVPPSSLPQKNFDPSELG